ncbi:MAG: ABC transporter ATP-binding protein [Deltaproteobacteria bacterium]|nr:ABC transporter ATP-binding protein [Deltaproteobacteria bacterium]
MPSIIQLARIVWKHLPKAYRFRCCVLLAMLFFGTLLEMLGIGMVIPIVLLLSSKNISAKFPQLVPWLEFFGNPSHEALIVGGMVLLVSTFCFKSGFLGLMAWKQAQFVFSLQAYFSQRLFEGYLRQPYIFHLRHNSAKLIRNVTMESSELVNKALMPGMLLITELLAMAGIALLLLVIEPLGMILLFFFIGLALWIFQRFTQDRLVKWGAKRQYHDGRRMRHLQQGLGGAKEIKLLGREEAFIRDFQADALGAAMVGQKQTTLNHLPRLWLEMLGVIGLAGLVFVIMGQGKEVGTLLPTIGVFAAAAFRLMPSANRVLSSLQFLKFSTPVVKLLDEELGRLAPPHGDESVPVPFRNELRFKGVAFRYPDADKDVLDRIELSIKRGTSVGFVGSSGAGKSTLVNILLGLLTPTAGSVEVDGLDIQANLRGWQNQLGYVPQSIFLIDDSLRRNVAFGLENDRIDEGAVWNAIRAAQLETFVRELPEGLETRVGERGVRLSGGQMQRIGIARALYHNPQVLVMDEATSALDNDTERGVMEAIKALHGRMTILIVAHRLTTIEHCDKVYCLENGICTLV